MGDRPARCLDQHDRGSGPCVELPLHPFFLPRGVAARPPGPLAPALAPASLVVGVEDKEAGL